MAARPGCSSSVPSLPPPRPKSPPEYPDLYGKRREAAKVQMLEREIGFLEEELKSLDGLQPASRCCKEVADFVVANPEPLIPTYQKGNESCRFWKWLCGMSCFSFSWVCCCCYSACPVQLPCSCNCNSCCSLEVVPFPFLLALVALAVPGLVALAVPGVVALAVALAVPGLVALAVPGLVPLAVPGRVPPALSAQR
ncbi:hypothetical protein NL676_033626 [Syzygium grande]|nr:hypothetical protein NL676_033626 [Syzygium grande]